MDFTLATPALLFPAASLLMLAYTNRFISVAAITRQVSQKLHSCDSESLRRQIYNLRHRIMLIKFMQIFGIASIALCVVSMMFLFLSMELYGKVSFGVSLVMMVISLLLSLWEAFLSGDALNIELQDLLDKS